MKKRTAQFFKLTLATFISTGVLTSVMSVNAVTSSNIPVSLKSVSSQDTISIAGHTNSCIIQKTEKDIQKNKEIAKLTEKGYVSNYKEMPNAEDTECTCPVPPIKFSPTIPKIDIRDRIK